MKNIGCGMLILIVILIPIGCGLGMVLGSGKPLYTPPLSIEDATATADVAYAQGIPQIYMKQGEAKTDDATDTMVFTVDSPSTPKYNLIVGLTSDYIHCTSPGCYLAGNTLDITVNDGQATTVVTMDGGCPSDIPPSSDNIDICTSPIAIQLQKGWNTITISNETGWHLNSWCTSYTTCSRIIGIDLQLVK